MKILLIGASGQLGSDLLPKLRSIGDVVASTRTGVLATGACEALDVTDYDAVRAYVTRWRPDVVVNATAYTAVDRAEAEAERADAVNHLAPRAMAAACAEAGARFVHYSTDYVFDGSASEPYAIDCPVGPVGVYGRSKAAGEQAVRDACPMALILRTAWVYSFHGQSFLRTMLRLAAERDGLRVVSDQVGCPTPSWFIAKTTADLLRLPVTPFGTHHLVTRGATSWHGFAEAIFDEALHHGMLARRPIVHAISTAEYPTPACRPAWSVLDPAALEALIEQPFPEWRSALSETFLRAVEATR